MSCYLDTELDTDWQNKKTKAATVARSCILRSETKKHVILTYSVLGNKIFQALKPTFCHST